MHADEWGCPDTIQVETTNVETGDTCKHKWYFIDPEWVTSNGFQELKEYTGRWYEVKCISCAIKSGTYRKRTRD